MMKPIRTHTKTLFTTLILGLMLVSKVQATTIDLIADGQWNELNVDDFSSLSQGVEWIDLTDSNSPTFGSALNYRFTIDSGFKGTLTIVDAGSAGDRFEIFNNGQSLGFTSITSNTTDFSNDFSSNLSNSNFSSNVFQFFEGEYDITGALLSSLQPFNATNGALKLEITAVPLPGAYGLFLCGIGLLSLIRRRRSNI